MITLAQPFWQTATLTCALPEFVLPARMDVVVLGAGAVGAACSGRNGGQVVYTFDKLPHLGRHGNLFYCLDSLGW